MRRASASAFLAAALVLFGTATASAQAKPDFSGKWMVDTEKTAAANPGMPQGGPGGGGRGMGMMMGPMTITMDATTLTRESEGRNGAMKTVFPLDGARHTVSMGQRDAQVQATWEGDVLVLTTTRETPNGSMTTRTAYALEGDWLVVSTTMRGRDGADITRKVYYRKN